MLGVSAVLAAGCVFAQESAATLQVANVEPLSVGYSSSAGDAMAVPSAAPRAAVTPANGVPVAQPVRPFSRMGIQANVGIGGIGFDTATPLARHFNLRMGADFFSYSDSFVEQGADVTASIQMRSGHAKLDWFPFKNGFRISPMVNYANNNKVRATVLVPAGSTITLSGADYISSYSDPLRGSGSVDFRKTSPGLTLGWGNAVPRSGKHFSFPVELGFYYVGQPTLKVAFTGSACDPTQPAAIGCQSVDTNQSFQQSLTAFRARNNNNLSYASFFPVFSTGIGYSF
ncbi:MAG TPA: hypothetical protein VNW54_01220 [Granulicella sp.]|nr:hypothetical protein [Granulicella sp.]